MKNLDLSIGNQGILDESFSNFTSNDVVDLRAKIKEAESRLLFLKSAPKAIEYIIQTKNVTAYLNDLKAKLASVPKSIIDAVDKNVQLQSDLTKSEIEKQQAAEVAAIEKQNIAIQEAIDKSKGVTDILNGKPVVSPVANLQPPVVLREEKTGFFTTKNIVIAIASLGAIVGAYYLIKKFK